MCTSHGSDKIGDFSINKIRKAATCLLCDTVQKRGFALPVATRASKVLGPISRQHVAQILPLIRSAARASRVV